MLYLIVSQQQTQTTVKKKINLGANANKARHIVKYVIGRRVIKALKAGTAQYYRDG